MQLGQRPIGAKQATTRGHQARHIPVSSGLKLASILGHIVEQVARR